MSGGTSQDGSYWSYYYNPKSTYEHGGIAYSIDNGVTWSSNADWPSYVPSGSMAFDLGWKQGSITATAEDTDSIASYGRHFRTINDSTINTLELAQARAYGEISANRFLKKKGTITIDGRTDMKTYYRFSSNLTNFGIEDIWDVVSYTQRIDGQGFQTIINYGKQPFDIMKVISDLE